MKTFLEFIAENDGGGMVSSVPANAVADGSGVAGITGDPPVYKKKRKKAVITPSPLKRTAPIKM
jgi:hypothetical protein